MTYVISYLLKEKNPSLRPWILLIALLFVSVQIHAQDWYWEQMYYLQKDYSDSLLFLNQLLFATIFLANILFVIVSSISMYDDFINAWLRILKYWKRR